MKVIKWFINASYTVHDDFRSHSGLVTKFGQGSAISASLKQKLNTRSSTEAELVGVDDFMGMIIWTQNVLEAQGYEVFKHILYQDNKNAILLENNGKASAGKRSRHLNVIYFFVKQIVDQGKLTIQHCPTLDMPADFMTKSLQGSAFLEFRNMILGM